MPKPKGRFSNPVVAAIVGALESAVIVGGISAIGAN
jgi:hypothetical protein